MNKWLRRCLGIATFSLLFCLGGKVGHAQAQSGNGWTYDTTTRVLKISGISDLTQKSDTSTTAIYEAKTLIIGNDVKTIGENAIGRYEELEKVCFEDKSKSAMTSFGDKAFYRAKKLKQVDFPDKLTYIGKECFRGCSRLEKVTIPSSVTTLEWYAFESSGVKEVEIQAKITKLLAYTFGYCNRLEKVKLPNTIATIDDVCFYEDRNLSTINLPNGITSIGESAFMGCKSLKLQALPSAITTIGRQCFENCTSITKLVFPKSLTSVGLYAFFESGLQEVGYEEGTTEIKSYQLGKGTSVRKVTMPNTVKKICKEAYIDCSELTEIKLSNSLETIESSVFAGCYKLRSIIIPASVKQARYVFYDSVIEEITFENGTTTIPFGICDRASSLKKVNLPETVKLIDGGAFCECTALEYIRIPKSVTTIDGWAFLDCSSLNRIDMECENPALGNDAFDFVPHNVFYVRNGSGFHQYCQKNNIRFVVVNEKSNNYSICSQSAVEEKETQVTSQVAAPENARNFRSNEECSQEISKDQVVKREGSSKEEVQMVKEQSVIRLNPVEETSSNATMEKMDRVDTSKTVQNQECNRCPKECYTCECILFERRKIEIRK